MMDYAGIALACPVTEPYTRRSTRSATWWLGRALARLLAASGLAKDAVDGVCLSSFTLAPDGPAPFLQQVGLSPRFLEFIPTGGACGIMAARRAARAVQCGDASVVACLAGDTADAASFGDLLAGFSVFSRDCVWPYGAGGPQCQLRPADGRLHARQRHHAGGFRPPRCQPAPQRRAEPRRDAAGAA